MATFWSPAHADTTIDVQYDNLQYPANTYDYFQQDLYVNGSYVLYAKNTSSLTGTSCAFRLTGLQSSTTYTIYGYAIYGGNSYNVGSVTVTTSGSPDPVPGLPYNINVSMSGLNGTLSFNPQNWTAYIDIDFSWISGSPDSQMSISPYPTNNGVYTEGTFTVPSYNTQYSLMLRARNATGQTSSWSSTYYFTSGSPPPSTPSSAPVITSRTEGGFYLSWGSGSNATSYVVQCRRGYDNYTTTYSFSGTTGSISGLQYGVSYYLSVKSVNSSGSSSYTGENQATTAPQSVACSISNITSNGLDVYFNTPTNNWTYCNIQLYQGANSNGTSVQGTIRVDNPTTGYRYSGLQQGTLYTAYVRPYFTINGVDIPAVSSNSAQGTTTNPPVTPSDPWVSSRGEGSITIAWSGSSADTSYVIGWSGESGTGQSYAEVSTTGTSYTFSNLTYGHAYYFQVKGRNSVGDSSWSNTITIFSAPKTPTISNTAVTYSSVTIQGNLSSGSYSYIRVYKNGSSTDYMDITTNGGSVTFTGLSSNTSYTFNAKTYDSYSSLWSVNYSNSLTITTSARPPSFSWDTSKTSGSTFNVTASEWTRLQNSINQFRSYKGLGSYSFTSVSSGQLFEAYLYRQCVTAISDMSPPTSAPPQRYTGDTIYASEIDGLRISLNSIQ